MTSERKAAANRLNASRSTGPKTIAGRQASANNALRHGLTSAAGADEALIVAIAREIPHERGYGGEAEAVARSQEQLIRIRRAKVAALAASIAAEPSDERLSTEEIEALALVAAAPQLLKLDEYERKALSRRKRALRALST